MLIFPTVVLAMAPEFGRSYSEMLPLSLGGFIMFGACSLPAGWLADHWSRRGMMIIFFIGIGAASILTGLAGSPLQIAAGLTLIGVFGAIYHPVGIAMLVSGRDKVGRVLGVNGVYGNFGVALAALIAGALAYWIHWRAAFIIPGALSIAAGSAFALLVPAPPRATRAVKSEGGVAIGRNTLVRVFAILTVATMCGGVIFNATTVAMPKIFDERLTALTQTTLGIGVALWTAGVRSALQYRTDTFIVIVMALIGMPLAISLGRKSTVVALCSAVVVSLAFWLVSGGFQQLGEHALLPPGPAVWTPIVIFACGGLYFISRVRT